MQKMYDFYKKKAQSNLIPHKGVLSYDTHDEKQVYRYIIKEFCKNLERQKQERLLNIFLLCLYS